MGKSIERFGTKVHENSKQKEPLTMFIPLSDNEL